MVLVSRKQKEVQDKLEQELATLRNQNEELKRKLDTIIASMEYNTKDLERLKQMQSKLLTAS